MSFNIISKIIDVYDKNIKFNENFCGIMVLYVGYEIMELKPVLEKLKKMGCDITLFSDFLNKPEDEIKKNNSKSVYDCKLMMSFKFFNLFLGGRTL